MNRNCNLHTRLFLLVIVGGLAFGSSKLGAQNLLSNSDFDSWLNDSTPTAWKLENRSRAGVLRSSETIYPPFCLRIERRVDSTGNNYGIRQDSIPVTGGQVYTVGCWLRVDTLPGGTVHYVSGRILITWRSANGNAIRTTSPAYVTSSDWLQQIYTDTAPDTATMASVMIRCYGRGNPKSIAGGLVYVDRAEFYQGAAIVEEAPGTRIRPKLIPAPNPFRSQVAFDCVMASGPEHRLRIYDACGIMVRELGPLQPGHYKLFWDGRDERGYELPGGIYFAAIESDFAREALTKVLFLR